MNSPYGTETAKRTAKVIRDRVGAAQPAAAIILGSGLGGLADQIGDRTTVPYADIPGFPVPTVVGHSGAVVAGTLGGQRVVALSGRFHMYEGHDAGLAGFPVRVLNELGARTLIVTNAAGGIRRAFAPGDIMLIRDHINLMFRNPLIGGVEPGEERFPDMSEPYDKALRTLAREVARSRKIALDEGVYIQLLGPSYETPAEIRMADRLGADAVGMSTAIEVIAARARGLRCLGFSVVTNLASGISPTKLHHGEVMETANRVRNELAGLVEGVIERL
jgi:purine-nucleoside phosphorylase